MIATLLEQAGFPTLQASNGEEALATARRARPMLVILDVRLPGVSGYEVHHELRSRFGDDLPIIFISGERVESLDRAGDCSSGPTTMWSSPSRPTSWSLECAASSRAPLRRARRDRGQKLTGREGEVLRLLASGLGQPEIAKELFISSKTVATHIQHILAKLGVHSRAQAVAVAHRDGLLRS